MVNCLKSIKKTYRHFKTQIQRQAKTQTPHSYTHRKKTNRKKHKLKHKNKRTHRHKNKHKHNYRSGEVRNFQFWLAIFLPVFSLLRFACVFANLSEKQPIFCQLFMFYFTVFSFCNVFFRSQFLSPFFLWEVFFFIFSVETKF